MSIQHNGVSVEYLYTFKDGSICVGTAAFVARLSGPWNHHHRNLTQETDDESERVQP